VLVLGGSGGVGLFVLQLAAVKDTASAGSRLSLIT
jgi:NADPH:quinone reductase-like Zn-dependent oxidoreductase